MQITACSGSLNCGQNTECGLACQVEGALGATCTPPDSVEVEAVSDPALYAELKKYGPQLAVLLDTVALLRSADGAINQQTIADFQNATDAGATDNTRQCIIQGQTASTQAHTGIQAITSADPTIVP
jgi:hypothetical protein